MQAKYVMSSASTKDIQRALNAIRSELDDANQQTRLEVLQLMLAQSQGIVAMARKLDQAEGIKAAKGDARSQKIFFDVVRDVEKMDELIYRELLENAVEYQDHWHQQIERCKAQGLPAPNPLPHPDHIHINYETGQVAIWGPVDKAEKKTFDSINALETKKYQMLANLEDEDDPDEREHLKKLIQIFDDVIDKLLQKWRA